MQPAAPEIERKRRISKSGGARTDDNDLEIGPSRQKALGLLSNWSDVPTLDADTSGRKVRTPQHVNVLRR